MHPLPFLGTEQGLIQTWKTLTAWNCFFFLSFFFFEQSIFQEVCRAKGKLKGGQLTSVQRKSEQVETRRMRRCIHFPLFLQRLAGPALGERRICWLCSMGKSRQQIYYRDDLAAPSKCYEKSLKCLYWPLRCTINCYPKQLRIKKGKVIIASQEMQGLFRRAGARGRWVSLTWSGWKAACPTGRPCIPVLSVNLPERNTGVIG